MVLRCLECKAKFGTPHTMSFHYKLKHKDKIGECKCGDIKLRGICLTDFIQEASGTNPNYFCSNSNSNSNPNPILNPNPVEIKFDLTNKVCNKCNVIK